MINLVKQIILYYFKNKKAPLELDLKIEDESLLVKKGTLFVTFYKSWEIVGSAWNVKEIENNFVKELIENTIAALNDKRWPIKASEAKDLKIRVDIITKREVISKQIDFDEINPVKYWVIAIRKDYEKLAVILPNINPNIFTSADLAWAISKKLQEKFDLKNFITYKIQTETISDF